jgi:hypothetical protein
MLEQAGNGRWKTEDGRQKTEAVANSEIENPKSEIA